MSGVTVEIKRHIATINGCGNGWTRQLNIVVWNGGIPKYDLREWDEKRERMTRGITFTEEEGRKILKALSLEFNE